MKFLMSGALALAIALAGCGDPPPRAPVVGQQARIIMDAAAAKYLACVDAEAAAVPLAKLRSGDLQAGGEADAIIKRCGEARTALIAKVYDFRRIGHPSEVLSTSHSVAQQSVDAVEIDLRERAVLSMVSRNVGADEPSATANKPVEKTK